MHPLLVTTLLGTAQAALPADLATPPPSVQVDGHGEPGMWMLTAQDGAASFTVRVRAAQDDPDASSPRCTGAGMELELVRWEGQRSDAAEGWLDALCTDLALGHPALPAAGVTELLDGRLGVRLDDMGLSLPSPPVPRPRGVPTLPTSWPILGWHGVVVAWFVALGLCLPRKREPWILAALALAVRVALTSNWALMGVGYPYLRMVSATGYSASDSPYGPTWGAFMGLLWFLSGGIDDHVHLVNLGLSVLSVPVLWSVVRRVAPPEAATLSAAMLALLPLAIALSRSETMFVLVAALQLTAALGLVDPHRRGGWLAVASIVLLVLLRPYQVGVGAVLTIALWARGRTVPALVSSVVIAVHTAGLLAIVQDAQIPTSAGLDKLGVLSSPSSLLGPGGTLALTDPFVTPLAAWLLVPWAWRERPRWAWLFAGLGLASALPYAIFERHSDVLRFTLPAATWLCALVGVGLVGMPPRARAPALVVVVLSFFAARTPVGTPFLWSQEHAHLLTALPEIPARAPVTYDPSFDEHGTFATWIQTRGHGVWHAGSLLDTAVGELHWLGRYEGAADLPDCAEPVDVVAIAGPTGNVEPNPGPVMVGLVRRTACASP